jgi:signal transduction histidine kinase
LAMSQECNRLARELHDTLGHRLTVAAVQLEGAQKLIPYQPTKAADMIGTVRQQVLEGLTELRGTVAALRTPLPDVLPFPQALSRLVNQFAQATGIPTQLALPNQIIELPTTYRQALYRAVQEGLTNIQKHAQAHDVSVRVDLLHEARMGDGVNTAVQVTIDDDGVGLTADARRPGFGLRGLQERAAQLNGHVSVDTLPEGGTRLSMRLPYRRGNQP